MINILLTLRLCFKSFHFRHDVARNSTKFIIFSKFILQILSLNVFDKNFLNICHETNETSRSSSYPKPNEVCQKFHFWKVLLNIYKLSLCDSPGNFRFGFITKKRLNPKFLLSSSTKLFVTWEKKHFIKITDTFLLLII